MNEIRKAFAQKFREQLDSEIANLLGVSKPHRGGKYTDVLAHLQKQITQLPDDARPYGNKTCVVLNAATYSDVIACTPEDDNLYGFPARAAGYMGGMRSFQVAYIYIDGQRIPLRRGTVLLANEDILPDLLGDQYKPYGEDEPQEAESEE